MPSDCCRRDADGAEEEEEEDGEMEKLESP